MLKVLMTIGGLAILTTSYAAATTTRASISLVSAAHHRAPAPLLAAGLPAFIALGGAGAVGALARRCFKSRRQAPVRDGRTVV